LNHSSHGVKQQSSIYFIIAWLLIDEQRQDLCSNNVLTRSCVKGGKYRKMLTYTLLTFPFKYNTSNGFTLANTKMLGINAPT